MSKGMEKSFIKDEIRRLCKEKNAIILAHYYTRDEVQDVADFIGDSLALAQRAAKVDADILVMCGVNFMAETCKILCPDKKVLIPDLKAGCSLADSCNSEELKRFKKDHPGYKVVSYVNTTADVKALSYMCVTSGNAKKIIDSFPQDEKLIFCPDFNLGSYINKVSGRNMLLWNGGCHVHSRFSVSALKELKEKNPGVKVLAHPECKKEILDLSDVIGSTAAILKYANESDDTAFIVATEIGIFYELKRQSPDKTFIPVPAETVGCNECEYMKMNTLENILEALKTEQPEIIVDESLSEKAIKPIQRMLDLS